MAEIVFGMAVPHSGMLGKPGETWLEDGERDRAKPELWYRARTWTFSELAEERKSEGFEALLTLEERQARSARCSKAIAAMRKAYEESGADIAVIIGKDQKEIFPEISPSIAIYSGEEIYNGPPQRAVYAPDHPVTHKGLPELAQHLLTEIKADGFDLADLFAWPDNSWMKDQGKIVPHAFGFVYRQIMGDNPPPTVPILMNTFYKPTQPTMARAIQFGHSLTKAIKSWKSDKKVAVIASGGLSHFVCDEAFDRKILGHLAAGDLKALEAVDDNYYQSGTSEIKLYASVLVAMAEIGAKMQLVDYIPCYRTEAGSGEGMGFMIWSK
jgi:3-O-methylgallate 3,4-dioxygenase